MSNNDQNNTNEKIDIFAFVETIWGNKWLTTIIIGTVFVLGITYNYISSNSHFSKNDITINILIEDSPFNPSTNNHFYAENDIVDFFNLKISSSYNYERWSETTDSSVYLSQKSANLLKVLKDHKIVRLGDKPNKTTEAITSYLTYSAQLVSKNIYNQIQPLWQNQINKANNEINNFQRQITSEKITKQNDIRLLKNKFKADVIVVNRNFKNEEIRQQKEMGAELLIVENDIQNQTDEIQAAELQLEYINTHIAEGNKTKIEVVVRQLDLLYIIAQNQLTIESLKKTKKALALIKLDNNLNELNEELDGLKTKLESDIDTTETTSTVRIIEWEENINQLNRELDKINNTQTNLSSNLVRLGQTLNNTTYFYRPSILLILIVAILTGLILSATIGTYKEEYKRRKKNKSN